MRVDTADSASAQSGEAGALETGVRVGVFVAQAEETEQRRSLVSRIALQPLVADFVQQRTGIGGGLTYMTHVLRPAGTGARLSMPPGGLE